MSLSLLLPHAETPGEHAHTNVPLKGKCQNNPLVFNLFDQGPKSAKINAAVPVCLRGNRVEQASEPEPNQSQSTVLRAAARDNTEIYSIYCEILQDQILNSLLN